MNKSNDSIILQTIVEKERLTLASSLTFQEYFEIFSAEQVLKNYDLTYDALQEGITDGGNDGSIDSLFCFIDNEELTEHDDYDEFRKNFKLEVYFIQSKSSGGFSEIAVRNMRDSVSQLTNLSRSDEELARLYNSKIIERIRPFRKAVREAAIKFPELHIHCIQCGLEANEVPSHQTEQEAVTLKTEVKKQLSSATVIVDFFGATKLLEAKRKTPSRTLSLRVTESPISSSAPNRDAATAAYICVVNLIDYFDFITAGTADLQRHLFESNVRDYQGRVVVNDQIRATLSSKAEEDFWWLNNGVTILAKAASLTGKTFSLEDPEIVNGLQTSNEIYNRFKPGKPASENRTLLVRLIVTNSIPTRDRIIRATNSQTAIPPASLRATDEIHRNIEDYFKTHGLFYDRRKNYYKNQNKPISSIVSISSLAQALMTVILLRPDSARARPASLLDSEETYKQLFAHGIPIQVYLVAAKLLKLVEEQQKKVGATSAERGETKFFALYVLAHRLCGAEPTVSRLAALSLNISHNDFARKAAEDSLLFFRNQGSGLSTKNQGFLQSLKMHLSL